MSCSAWSRSTGLRNSRPVTTRSWPGCREVRGARRVVPGAALPRPRMPTPGEYDHPGYGTLTITVDGDTLRPHLGTMDLSLAHRHYETFDLEWHELGDQSHIFPLMFLSDPDGDITALTVPFEPSVGPLRFGRLPDAPARDPEVLRRLCGTYAMGPIEVVVAQQGDHVLTVTTPGAPPFELQANTGPALRGEGPARHHRRIRAGPGRRGRPPRGTATGDIPPQDITGRRPLDARSRSLFTPEPAPRRSSSEPAEPRGSVRAGYAFGPPG